MTIEPQFIEELQRTLSLRRIAKGVARLRGTQTVWTKLRAGDAHATEFLLLIAQWVDVGYRDYRLLDSLLERFSATVRRKLSMDDYLRLRAVEGFRALSAEEADTAIEKLDFVLRAEPGAADEQFATVVHFWKGRAHRKKGEYEKALEEIVLARKLAQKTGASQAFSAVIQLHEAWLLFQKGSRKETIHHLLEHSEAALKATDDGLAKGNIESVRGRIARRSGEYTKALVHFDRAIKIYSTRNKNHQNLARTLVHAALVNRLLALRLSKGIDARAHNTSLRNEKESDASPNGYASQLARHKQYCEEAKTQLQRARKIYRQHGHSVGLGTVIVNTGYLYLDGGSIDRAAKVALVAYRIGQEKNDPILMARARVLQTATENARVEEQVGDAADTALYANHAKEFSDEAVDLAKQTQYRSLLASAYLAQGMTAANDFFKDWDKAKRCAADAGKLLEEGENNHLVDELAELNSRIMQASVINDRLREWSEGLVGKKTFQQISEDFARIVITKVWEHEGKNISRVADRLSISPKKVRRLLSSSGAQRSHDTSPGPDGTV